MGKKASLRQQGKAAKARKGEEEARPQAEETVKDAKFPEPILRDPKPIIQGTEITREL